MDVQYIFIDPATGREREKDDTRPIVYFRKVLLNYRPLQLGIGGDAIEFQFKVG